MYLQHRVQWILKSNRGVTSVELSLVFFLFSFVNFYVELLLITAVALIKIVNT